MKNQFDAFADKLKTIDKRICVITTGGGVLTTDDDKHLCFDVPGIMHLIK
ncbi:MAG TPA: hypothetical protein VFW07_01370 [Parafilimonas sp.]|nr:hypothetical protein [Parafilimonas sp.]